MKKIIRLSLCWAMLFVAIGAHAQTAADGIYSQAMALKKQRTKASLTQAISKFKRAKGLYATEAGKDKCDAQISACYYLMKRKPTPTPTPKPIIKDAGKKTVVEEVAQVDKHKNVEISLSEDYLDFKSRMEGGAQSVTVTCNYDDWYIEDQPKWVKASKAGNDKIYVEVEDNLGKEKRSGVVSIKCGDVDVDLVINQKKADITRKVKEGAVKVWKSLFGGKKDK